MPSKRCKPVPRKQRADALRNRERILEIAKDAFTRSGGNIILMMLPNRQALALERYTAISLRVTRCLRRFIVRRWKIGSGTKEVCRDDVSGRGVAGLDAALRRLHRGEADHRTRTEHYRWRALEAIRSNGGRSKARFTPWWNEPSRAGTSALTSIHSICSGLSSAFPMSRRGQAGRKAQEDWWTSSSSVPGRLLKAVSQLLWADKNRDALCTQLGHGPG